jgi:hypothetical protein
MRQHTPLGIVFVSEKQMRFDKKSEFGTVKKQ